MGVVSTRELLDSFYANDGTAAVDFIKKRIDTASFFKYEKEIGKELIDMNVQDLIIVIKKISVKKNTNYKYSNIELRKITSYLRRLFNYYIKTYQPIYNPFTSDEMRSDKLVEEINKDKISLTMSYINQNISFLRSKHSEDRIDYVELFANLFLDGFYSGEEILEIKDAMINHDDKTINIGKKIIHLSDRTYYLLLKNHSSSAINDGYGAASNHFLSYKGSFVKLSVRMSQEELDSKQINVVALIFYRVINDWFKKKCEIRVTYKDLYWIGFYEFLIEKIGLKKINQILSKKLTDVNKLLLTTLAREYGVPEKDFVNLRIYLKPFIK